MSILIEPAAIDAGGWLQPHHLRSRSDRCCKLIYSPPLRPHPGLPVGVAHNTTQRRRARITGCMPDVRKRPAGTSGVCFNDHEACSRACTPAHLERPPRCQDWRSIRARGTAVLLCCGVAYALRRHSGPTKERASSLPLQIARVMANAGVAPFR